MFSEISHVYDAFRVVSAFLASRTAKFYYFNLTNLTSLEKQLQRVPPQQQPRSSVNGIELLLKWSPVEQSAGRRC